MMSREAVSHDPLGLGVGDDEGELVPYKAGEEEPADGQQDAHKEKRVSSSSSSSSSPAFDAAKQILADEPFSSSSSSATSSSVNRDELFGGKRTSVFGESTFEVTEAVIPQKVVDEKKSASSSSRQKKGIEEGAPAKKAKEVAPETNDLEDNGFAGSSSAADEQKFDDVDLRSPSSTVRAAAPTGYEQDEVPIDRAAQRRMSGGKQASSEELDVVVTKLESFPPPMSDRKAKRVARQSQQQQQKRKSGFPTTAATASPSRAGSRRSGPASSSTSSSSSSSSSSSASGVEGEDQVYDIGIPVTHVEEAADEEPYAVYHIEFSTLASSEPRTVVKRFSQFYNLHEALHHSFPEEEMPSFPSRIVLGNSLEPRIIDERQKLLDRYMKELLGNKRLWNSFHIKLFLDLYDLTGKVAIVTGASSGVGLQTALALARLNAHVIFACRSRSKTEAVMSRIQEETGNDKLEFIELDLASLDSVRQFASVFTKRGLPLNYLINNAGVAGEVGKLTQDGFEVHMGVNYIGHFLLTNLLLDELNATATKCGEKSRIINVVSRSHMDAREIAMSDSYLFNPTTKTTLYPAFVQSKLALVMFTNELAVRLEGMKVVANAVHPGPVATETFFKQAWNPIPFSVNWLSKKLLLSEEEGARCTLFAVLADQAASVSGRYFESCKEKAPNPVSHNRALMSQLWEYSESWTGLAE